MLASYMPHRLRNKIFTWNLKTFLTYTLCLNVLGAYDDALGIPPADQCGKAKTCRSCVAINPKCAWCAEDTYETHATNRCMEKKEIFYPGPIGCRGRWYSPDSSVKHNNPSILEENTRISPTEAKFALRPGAAESIDVSVKIQDIHILRGKLRCKLKVKSDIIASITSKCNRFRRRKSAFVCYGPFKKNRIASLCLLFHITVKALKCLSKTGRAKFRIFPGKTNHLTIKVYTICSCSCESKSERVTNDVSCSKHGDKVCGHCECHDNFHGKRCECPGPEPLSDSCLIPNKTSVCSNKGKCVCGRCDCDEIKTIKYYGKHCECNDQNCSRYENMICGGMNRGRCLCGRCICRKGFIGSACQVPTSVTGCVSSKGLVCSNHGACIKGRCRCDVPYHGDTCELCDVCGGICSKLKDCVQCSVFRNGKGSLHECDKVCYRVTVHEVDMLVDDGGQNNPSCIYKDPIDESHVFFRYRTINDTRGEFAVTVQINRG